MLKFAAVGAFNTALCLLIIYFLKWSLFWGDISANLVGYFFCVVIGFILNSFWTFSKSELNSRQFYGYIVVAVTAYIMNLISVLISIKIFQIQSDYAQLVGVPIFTITSFLLNKFFVFRAIKIILL